MRGVVDCFGGGFEKIASALAPETVEHEFGVGFASGVFLDEPGVQCDAFPFKQRRGCRARRLVKNELVFYKRNSRLSGSARSANGSKTVRKLNMQRRRAIPNGIRKISYRRPRSVDDAELGLFTLLFCRGRQVNVQRFITHVHSYCSAY